jgi:hypothetical protein
MFRAAHEFQSRPGASHDERPQGSTEVARHPAISERGPLLEIDDGPVWRLDTEDDLQPYRDLPVRVEAWARGTSLLELLWIGPV